MGSSSHKKRNTALNCEALTSTEPHHLAYLQKGPEHAPSFSLNLDRDDVEPGLVQPAQEPTVTRQVLRADRTGGVQLVPVMQNHGGVGEEGRQALRSGQVGEGDRDACGGFVFFVLFFDISMSRERRRRQRDTKYTAKKGGL